MQAYVALTAAFARLFFRELYGGRAGELWAPRMYTVLPYTAILFYVYWRAGSDKQDSGGKSRLPFEALLAYLGTGKHCGSAVFSISERLAGDGVGGGCVYA